MITNTWKIVQLDCKPLVGSMTEYVTSAHWILTGTDGTHTASTYGSTSFEIDPNKTSYIPFKDITSEIIEAWVKERLGEDLIKNFESAVANQIEDQINPSIVSPPLPWSV